MRLVSTSLLDFSEEGRLVLAPGPVEAGEALTEANTVVADSSPGTVTTGFVAVPVQRVSSRWTLTHLARWSAVPGITQTSDVLVRVPRQRVSPSSLGGEDLLGPTGAMLAALVRTHSALTSYSLVPHKAIASSCFTVASPLIRAFSPRVKVIGVHHTAHPRVVFGAGAKGAVCTYPVRFPIEASVAFAVPILLASSMSRALVIANASLAMSAAIPGDLPPFFRLESG